MKHMGCDDAPIQTISQCPSKHRSQRVKSAGFTLIELAVVIVIIGVLASVVRIGWNFDAPNASRSHALAIKGIIEKICDIALFEQKVTVLIVGKDGFGAVYYPTGTSENNISDIDSWDSISGIQFPEELQKLGSKSIEVAAEKFLFTEKNTRGWGCWPTGNMTEGGITIIQVDPKNDSAQTDAWSIAWDSNGEITIEALE